MKLFIPSLGETFTLASDWTFRLFTEHRNTKTAETLGLPHRTHFVRIKDGLLDRYEDHWVTYKPGTYDVQKDYGPTHDVTLPAGTLLSIDRYYIKKGAKDYDSVTLYAKRPGDKRKLRFWVKLADANNIEI